MSAGADVLALRGTVRVWGRATILVDVDTDGWLAHPFVTHHQGGRQLQASLLSVEASPGSDTGDGRERSECPGGLRSPVARRGWTGPIY